MRLHYELYQPEVFQEELKAMMYHPFHMIYTDISDESHINELLKMGVPIFITTKKIPGFQKYSEQFETAGGVPKSIFYIAMKRLLDIIGGLVGCVITSILFCILGPIIYFESPGPIIFKQKRIGYNGRVIPFYKFRSMKINAEDEKEALKEQNEMNGCIFKIKDDPRVTKIGKFMRKMNIDEFPQFFSVLKGDMSLVGTRPPTLDEFAQYQVNYRARLACKPGITGIWQTSGRNNIQEFEDIVAMDCEYIKTASMLLHIKLLLKTIFFSHGKGW